MSSLYKIDKNKSSSQIDNKDESEFLEKELEDLLEKNPSIILNKELLIIGRQVVTDSQKRIDLLSVDSEGTLFVIELKRGIAPREMIAQVLDYTSWLNDLSERQIEKIARDYFDKQKIRYSSLLEAFEDKFKRKLDFQIGLNLVNVLFAQDFHKDLFNATNYLYGKGVEIYCIKFEMFSNNEISYLHTDFIIGNDKEISLNKVIQLPDKNKYRETMKKVSEILNEKYEDWASNLDWELEHSFKIYQSKSGDWTCAYIDWSIDGVRFAYEVGIVHENTDEKPGFCADFYTRRNSKFLKEKINKKEIQQIIENLKLENETENDLKPYYTKYHYCPKHLKIQA